MPFRARTSSSARPEPGSRKPGAPALRGRPAFVYRLSPMASGSDKYVVRSTLGWVWFGLAALVCGYLLVDMAIRGSVWDAFLVAPWLGGVCWLVWIFQVSPRIVADDEGARVVNVLRVIDLPWSTVESVRLRYNTEFVLRTGAKVTAW